MIKRFMFVMLAALLTVGGVFATVQKGKPYPLKAGDTAYICGCGCDCGSLAKRPGKCVCGDNLIKAKVAKVENGNAYFMVAGKERVVPLTAKYACACGKLCPCKMIAQKPGKCTCGKEMKEVK